MFENAIEINNLGKMYKLFQRPSSKILNALGIDKLFFWQKNSYREFWALRELNLNVRKGERLGIIGRNGAGKSTLLKIIAGNVTPTEGEIKVQGRIQALMELGTGFHPEFTGRQNIKASLSYQGIDVKKILAMEEEIIDFAELDEFIDQPVKTYSAGMYSRLAFSVATAVEPEILIIDEVLGAGDAYFTGKCIERMRKLTDASGATVLFVSHDLGSVQSLCDRVIWVNRGVICAEGNPLTVIKQYSAEVRRDEEIRLKTRDLKISKKYASLLDRDQDIYQSYLFRFVGIDGAHPGLKHKIRFIGLKCNQEIIGTIEPGAPMDNNPDQRNYLLDEPGYMDWGPAGKDEIGHFRPYGNFNGKFAHAPFEFSVPKSYLHLEKMTLEIKGDFLEPIGVELFIPDSNKYERIGIVEEYLGCREFVLQLNNSTEKDIQKTVCVKEQEINDIDEYGTKQAVITNTRLLNIEGNEVKTLFCNEPFRVVVEYEAKKPLLNPIFVFCIYSPAGICISQWITSSKDLGIEIVEGKGNVIFEGDDLLIGRGAYIASVAIFKHFDISGIEPEAYHLLDRCIHFQISDRNEIDRTDYGVCRQPVRVTHYVQ
ncbi:MAG: ABC transporter ATP-binding protein [Firmicutes bacterium]|nr:ABC transporter ATP-binding protein [Bacillota bacterium]